MALLQTVLARYYPQCSGMPQTSEDFEMSTPSNTVTPLRYSRRPSQAPSVGDLTGMRAPDSRVRSHSENSSNAIHQVSLHLPPPNLPHSTASSNHDLNEIIVA